MANHDHPRHAWDRLAVHRYRCRRCGLLKTHIPVEVGRATPDWQVQFTAPDGTLSTGRTPLCPGQAPDSAPVRPVAPARGLGQYNAYVESGASVTERRARLDEVPEEWRDAVRAHVALVFQLRDAARLRRAPGLAP